MSNGRRQNRNKHCLIKCGFSSYKKTERELTLVCAAHFYGIKALYHIIEIHKLWIFDYKMGLSFTKREIRLQSGILHYKMGFLGYKRDSHVAIHLRLKKIARVHLYISVFKYIVYRKY